MAGGPIYPLPPYTADTTGSYFPNFHVGTGTNASPTDYGLGVAGSVATAGTWQLRYPLPPTIPSGQMKMLVRAIANAGTGNAIYTINDGVATAGQAPSNITLIAETAGTMSWASGDNDKYKEAKVSLTSTAVGNGVLVANIVFSTAATPIGVVSTWNPILIWE